VTESDQPGGEADAGLPLVSVRRHAGRALECAKQAERRQTGSTRDISQSDPLIKIVVEKIARQTDRAVFATDSVRDARLPRMAFKQPRDESQILFFKRRTRSLRTMMDTMK
jgi:hypothetical protein